MSDSDSSDEGNLELLREATDREFINDSMFKPNTKDNIKEEKEAKTLPPSLRKTNDEDEQFNLFRVTPEFRSHVAKHLMKILDNKLEKALKMNNYKIENHNNSRNKSSGVKLFSDSNSFIKLHSQNNNSVKQVKYEIKKRKIKDIDSSDDDENKIKSVAVSGELILSHKGTEMWTYKQKIFNYKKLKNGTLISLDKE